MKKLLFLLILLGAKNLLSQNTKPVNSEIDRYINTIQSKNNIPGVALAVIKNKEIIHKKFYGNSNLDYNIPVNEKTLFPLFSTSKIFATVAIHNLIQDGKISLDDRISKYLIDLPDKWENRTIQNLITHSSGLPEIAVYEREPEEVAKEKVYKDSIRFNPGEKFDYNQTNFWLLNRLFHQIIGVNLAEYIMQTQFSGKEPNALFEGNSLAVVKNRATSYSDYPTKGFLRETNYNNPPYLYGASGFNSTLDSFIVWNQRFDNNEFLNAESKKRLFTPYQYKVPRPFVNGWYMEQLNGHTSYYFTGSFSTGFKKFPDKDLTIIFLTNGSQALLSVNKIMNHIAGLVDLELVVNH